MMNKILHRFSSARREQVLLDFAEQRLNSRQQARVARHLARCARCREELDEHQAYMAMHQQRHSAIHDGVVYQLPKQSLPPALSDRLHRQIRAISNTETVSPSIIDRSVPSRPSWSSLVNRPVIATAVLLILLAVAGLLNLNPGKASQPIIPEWGQALDTSGVQDGAAAKMDNPSGQSQALEEQRAQPDAAPAAQSEPIGATEAAAGVMMAEAAPAGWQDALANDLILPLHLANQPEKPVLAEDLAGEALSAVWIDSGYLLIAYPQEQATADLTRIEKLLKASQPAVEVTMMASESIADWLSTSVPDADWQTMIDHLVSHESTIIVITIGGS